MTPTQHTYLALTLASQSVEPMVKQAIGGAVLRSVFPTLTRWGQKAWGGLGRMFGRSGQAATQNAGSTSAAQAAAPAAAAAAAGAAPALTQGVTQAAGAAAKGTPLRTAWELAKRNTRSVGNLVRNPREIPGAVTRNLSSGLQLAAKHPLAAAGVAGAGLTGTAALSAGLGYGSGAEEGAARAVAGFQDQNVLARLMTALAPGMALSQLPLGVQERIARLNAERGGGQPPNPISDWMFGKQY